jgi:hypothetical protein
MKIENNNFRGVLHLFISLGKLYYQHRVCFRRYVRNQYMYTSQNQPKRLLIENSGPGLLKTISLIRLVSPKINKLYCRLLKKEQLALERLI